MGDKVKLFSEFCRVLKPGGCLGVFDVMQLADQLPEQGLPFPMPWASEAACSFVETPAMYKEYAAKAGLKLEKEENRRDAVLEMLAKQLAAGTSVQHENPLALNILMG